MKQHNVYYVVKKIKLQQTKRRLLHRQNINIIGLTHNDGIVGGVKKT